MQHARENEKYMQNDRRQTWGWYLSSMTVLTNSLKKWVVD